MKIKGSINIAKGLGKFEKQVRSKLQSHDWYHMMSDSHDVWHKGSEDMKEIAEMLSFFSFEQAVKIYNEHAPNRWCSFTQDEYNSAKKRVANKLARGIGA